MGTLGAESCGDARTYAVSWAETVSPTRWKSRPGLRYTVGCLKTTVSVCSVGVAAEPVGLQGRRLYTAIRLRGRRGGQLRVERKRRVNNWSVSAVGSAIIIGHCVQLFVKQPSTARRGESDFAHQQGLASSGVGRCVCVCVCVCAACQCVPPPVCRILSR